MILEIVVLAQMVTIVALAGLLVSTHARLFRAAMARTPSHYRAAEKAAVRPAPPPTSLDAIDEAAAMVLSSMGESVPSTALPRATMPHGLGGE